MKSLLRLDSLNKAYATTVLRNISLQWYAGEVVGLVGENGAGKSTLSRIIAGIETAQAKMWLNEEPYHPPSRRAAEAQGVRLVLQELNLIPTLSIAENLCLGHWPQRLSLIDQTALLKTARAALKKVGLEVDPRRPVSQLGMGQQQLIALAQSLMGPCQVLILDEPTALLTPYEIQQLFSKIKQLKAAGVLIVFISHRLDEVQTLADRITVLRDGEHRGSYPAAALTHSDLVRLMVGHEVSAPATRHLQQDQVLLRVSNLSGGQTVRAVSFDVRAGEIFGLAGLVGSGRSTLLRLIYGATRPEGGEVYLYGSSKPAKWRSPHDAVKQGLGLVSEDRKSQGLLLSQSIIVNTTLANLTALSTVGWINQQQERTDTLQVSQDLSLGFHSLDEPVATLSGGNQQKVLFARCLLTQCKILLLDEPTRGIDINARADLYQVLNTLAQTGKALLIVSSDLPELMQLCDRIGVLSAGRLVDIFTAGQYQQQTLLEAMFSNRGQRAEVRAGITLRVIDRFKPGFPPSRE